MLGVLCLVFFVLLVLGFVFFFECFVLGDFESDW